MSLFTVTVSVPFIMTAMPISPSSSCIRRVSAFSRLAVRAITGKERSQNVVKRTGIFMKNQRDVFIKHKDNLFEI